MEQQTAGKRKAASVLNLVYQVFVQLMLWTTPLLGMGFAPSM
jgi:hypothetical protein